MGTVSNKIKLSSIFKHCFAKITLRLNDLKKKEGERIGLL